LTGFFCIALVSLDFFLLEAIYAKKTQ